MKRLIQILVIGALVALLTTLASAQVPQMINYQGKLTTTAGAPVNDTIQMVFTIYSDSAGTNPLWTETQSAVVVEKGVFNVLLGSVNPISYSVFDGSVRYLGVKVGTDPEITPRKPMVSVGYAFHSGTADTAYFSMPDADWTINGDTIYHLNGNVGIGTTSPVENLHICESGNNYASLRLEGNRSVLGGWANVIDLYAPSSPAAADRKNFRIINSNPSITEGENHLEFRSVNDDGSNHITSILTMTHSGNVGIGTFTPSHKLEVIGTALFDPSGSADEYVRIKSSGGIAGQGALRFDQGSTHFFTMWTTGTSTAGTFYIGYDGTSAATNARMVLNYNGTVGIGTTAPEAGLHVLHSSNTEYAFKVHNNGGSALGVEITGGANSATPLLNVHSSYSGGDRQGLWVQSNGKVGIGTTSPNEQLEITGNLRLPATTATAGIIKVGGDRFIHNYGTDNTFVGINAGNLSMTGHYNTANGNGAFYYNTTGGENTANGAYALGYNTTGGGNTANGFGALDNNTTGYENTALGSFANVSSDNLTNATAIGYGAAVDASNKVRIGNTAVTSIGGQVGWTTFSDGRYKKSISENVPGLAFISKLKPVTYTMDVDAIDAALNPPRKPREGQSEQDLKPSAEEMASKQAQSQIVYTGFIAQEVEQAAKETGYDFSGVDAPKNDKGMYGLRYAEFVVPLVKAVQEQQKIIEELQKRIEELEKK